MANKVYYTDRIGVDSSVLDNLYFVPKGDGSLRGTVYVEFTTGRIAGYRDVPKDVFLAFAGAESAGRYYNDYVKNRYFGVTGDVELVYDDPDDSPDTTDAVAKQKFVVRWEWVQTGETEIEAEDGKKAAELFRARTNVSGEVRITKVVVPEVEVAFE